MFLSEGLDPYLLYWQADFIYLFFYHWATWVWALQLNAFLIWILVSFWVCRPRSWVCRHPELEECVCMCYKEHDCPFHLWQCSPLSVARIKLNRIRRCRKHWLLLSRELKVEGLTLPETHDLLASKSHPLNGKSMTLLLTVLRGKKGTELEILWLLVKRVIRKEEK